MQEVSHSTVTCRFCGAPLRVECVSDNGVDWLGHHRGREYSYEDKEKCKCQLGTLEGAIKPLKKMCLNCIFFKGGGCTSKAEIAKINSMLDNHDIQLMLLSVKDPKKCCEHHKLDYSIFDSLFESGKDEFV